MEIHVSHNQIVQKLSDVREAQFSTIQKNKTKQNKTTWNKAKQNNKKQNKIKYFLSFVCRV